MLKLKLSEQCVQAMAGVLHQLLHTYTETAISVTSGLITSITRFAVQVCHW